jgi:murein DD-endopeptidase MepM/ murein hydrolase activator NlpD
MSELRTYMDNRKLKSMFCLINIVIMKKVALTSLFILLFNTNGQNSTIIPELENEPDSKEDISNRQLINKINYAIEENGSVGLTWSDNMPLFSPIRIDSTSRISDYFGMRQNHPILHRPKFHFGIDFDSDFGVGVHATASGTVIKVQHKRWGYGNNIIIDHGDGYKTRYAHLATIFVKEGDTVKLDNIIGCVGSTGMSTGPHLHYEVIFNNKPIDPLLFYFTSGAVNKNGNDYVNILIDLERTKNQLLNNNNSFWEQAGIPSQIQNQT